MRCPHYFHLQNDLPGILQRHGTDSQLTVLVPAAAAVDSSPLVVAMNNFSMLARPRDANSVRCDSVVAGVSAVPHAARYSPGYPKAGITVKDKALDPAVAFKAWSGSLYAMSTGN